MAKAKKIQAIRGMNDILPAQSPLWQYLEKTLRELLAAYAYQEIRFPVLEQTQLFKRSIGEVTDIVEKEMYTFEDRNGDSLSLRPEGTACCVRAAEQHGLLFNQVQKLWYLGPMYRHERPQKGRYRQFHQVGVEAFGMSGLAIEAELIMLSAELWKKLGLTPFLQLEMNNLGKSEDRAKFGADLKAYLLEHKADLDEDSQRRLETNVLRILDSKSPQTQAILENAPHLGDYIDAESHQEFESLRVLLEQTGIQVKLNPSLVRGLDYYNGLVFEWTTEHLGAQATVCAGGRFDGLSKQLGGSDTPAVGFAMGLERLLLLIEEVNLVPNEIAGHVDVYLVVIGADRQKQALLLAEHIRQEITGLRVLTHCSGGKYNSQLKKAFASGARCALILEGDEDLSQVRLKMLDNESETKELDEADVVKTLVNLFKN